MIWLLKRKNIPTKQASNRERYNMTTETEFAYMCVVHDLKDCVSVTSPVILNDTERAYIVEILLKKHRAVQDVQTVPATGSITIDFEPALLTGDKLLIMLDAILGNLGQYKRSTIAMLEQVEVDIPEHSFNLNIKGMTCASCALLLEMLLKRDSRIHQATVNFATQSATVTGYINQTVLFQMIENAGYKAEHPDSLN